LAARSAGLGPPSPRFLAHAERLREAATRGPVLDLASGRGRHAIAAARLGATVVALDRNADFLSALRTAASRDELPVHVVRADLEAGHAIPLRDGAFGVVMVFRYLHRPLARSIERLLSPGGLLLYETFSEAQRDLEGGPNDPAFLLSEGELPTLFEGLQTLDYGEEVRGDPASEAVAWLLARRPF
jgi:tellurite methyltransferase